ncbi:hypothetical protein QBC45DRAFT_321473, partial [Copromyces sp. CBS 386.78]
EKSDGCAPARPVLIQKGQHPMGRKPGARPCPRKERQPTAPNASRPDQTTRGWGWDGIKQQSD